MAITSDISTLNIYAMQHARRTGALSPDLFAINDVVLQIPPTQITVNKNSFKNEWSTLRTSSARKVKSGYSIAEVNLEIIFQGEDIAAKLVPLIAGLRSTPFAAVHNPYLEDLLLNNELLSSDENTSSTIGFRTIVLALTQATFTTQGHEGKPGCIKAFLSFIWFNYLPYTPVWAYKTGKGHDSPGYAWQSDVWKKFYEPFRGVPVSFPEDNQSITFFEWNEFKVFMKGDAKEKALAKDLIAAIKNRPGEILKASISGLTNKVSFPDGSTKLYNYLLKTAAKNGWLENFKDYEYIARNSIAIEGNKDVEALAESLSGETLSKAIQTAQLQGMDAGINYLKSAGKTQADKAIKILSERIKNNRSTASDLNAVSGYKKMTEVNLDYQFKNKYSYGKISHSVGATSLYAKEKVLVIDPTTDLITNGPGKATVIEHISVTISNKLALIPLVGFNYPTCQHIGNTDMSVSMSINVHNTNLKNIHNMYSDLETTARKFRLLPAPFLNLKVSNDFLSLFQINETITDSISTSTVSLDRSIVTLSLSDPGLKISDKLQDGEQLQQEYIRQHKTVQQGIWDVLNKNIKDVSTLKTASSSVKGKSEALFSTLTASASKNFNEWLSDLESATIKASSSTRQQAYAALVGLRTNPDYSFIPGLERAITAITKQDAERKQLYWNYKSVVSDQASTVTSSQEKAYQKEKKKYLSPDAWKKSQAEIHGKKENLTKYISDLELNDYLSEQMKLIDKIKTEDLGLKQFEKVRKEYYHLGIDRGLPAYPDFAQQLNSVRSLAPTGTEIKEIDLDPDVYMWYPMYGSKSSSESLIDPVSIARIKEQSLRTWASCEKDIGTWFEKQYMQDLKSDSVSEPYERLKKETGGKFPGGLYKNLNYKSAANQETIKKSVVIDALSRAHTHKSTKGDQIKPLGSLSHTTDLRKLLDGSTASPTGATPTINQDLPLSPAELAAMPYAAKYASEYGLPVDLVMGLIYVESSFRPNIVHIHPDTGREVAHGYMQLKKSTAADQARNLGIEEYDIYDPDFNIRAGCYYLSLLIKKTKNVDWGVASYNRGRGVIMPWIRDEYTIDTLPSYNVNAIKAKSYVHDVRKRRTIYAAKLSGVNPKSFKTPAKTSTPVADANLSVFDKSLQAFENKIISGHLQSLQRAYPTFKLYFIEDDYGEKKRLAFDDFFSYNAVKSIRVVRSKHIAADLCDIVLTNASGILSNRKFDSNVGSRDPLDKKGKKLKESKDRSAAGTDKENPLGSFLLKEGMNISLKLGYSNDPNNLPTVFTGKIMGVEFSENDDIIRVIAQSFATELVQDTKGVDTPIKKNGGTIFGWDMFGIGNGATTSKILEEVLSSEEVVHFGRWKAGINTNPAREMLTNKWRWWPTPYDDNLYPPPKDEDYLLTHKKDWIIKIQRYIIFKTTIWDIIQEMTYRHPNYIASAVPYQDEYGDRMTLFFGLPDQLYFARHPNLEERNLLAKINAYDKLKQDALRASYEYPELMNRPGYFSAEADTNRKITQSGLFLFDKALRRAKLNTAMQSGYIQPFRKYHFYTSSNHIISNNIKANSKDVANAVTINYRRSSSLLERATNAPDADKDKYDVDTVAETYTLKLDNALPPEEMQMKMGEFINVENEALARRYALTMLNKDIKNVYKGDLVVIGDPDPKPYDVCFIYDEYTDMVGPVEVEQVILSFTQEEGFRTTIKPDMLSYVSEFASLTIAQAFGKVSQKTIYDFIGQNWVSDLFQSMSSSSISMFGEAGARGPITRAILYFTQTGLPIITLPLLYKGRELTGGISTRKIPQSQWEIFKDKWRPRMLRDTEAWSDELYDDMVNWATKVSGGNSVGDFWSGDNE